MWTIFRRLRMSMVLVFAFVFLLRPPFAWAEKPTPGTVRVDANFEILPNGDGTGHIVLGWSARQYNLIKSTVPNSFLFLRNLESDRADFEIAPGATSRYDDATCSVVMDLTEKGALKDRGNGVWELQIERGPEFVTQKVEADGRTAFYFYEHGAILDGRMATNGQALYRVPQGAKNPEWDAAHRIIRFQLPCAGRTGSPRVTCSLQAKPRLMSTLYKVYGLGTEFAAMWVAKAVFENAGDGVLHNLQVRYRLEGYSEWSMWDTAEEMVPGQTHVSTYYPVLDKSIARLHSNTPANVEVEWRYKDAQNQEVTGQEARKVTILGSREFLFGNLTAGESLGTFHDDTENAPFAAAWVTRDDAVIKQYAAVAFKKSGVIEYTRNDTDKDGNVTQTAQQKGLKALASLYNQMVESGITYQLPPDLLDKSVSFDVQCVQNVKFPRDVLRDRSGTCIDLAILYAAMANELGLKSYLMLIPGHCFPVVELPSGMMLGIEATGVRNGPNGVGDLKARSFEWAVEVGTGNLQKMMADGRYWLVDLQDLWTRGVSNPEMEDLPTDILEKWHVIAAETRAEAPRVAPEPGPSPAPQPQPTQASLSPVGAWFAQWHMRTQNGQMASAPVYLTIEEDGNGGYRAQARADFASVAYGQSVTLRFEESFVGSISNGVLMLQGQQSTWTNLSTRQCQPNDPDTCVIGANGQGLVARVHNPQGGDVEMLFTRR